MINKILAFLNPALPIGLALKGLEKVDPRMKNFFAGSIAAGFGTNEALSYLRKKFDIPGREQEKQRLQEDGLRPDEMAAGARVEQDETPLNVVQGLASLAGGGIGGKLAANLIPGQQQPAAQNPPHTPPPALTNQPAPQQPPGSPAPQANTSPINPQSNQPSPVPTSAPQQPPTPGGVASLIAKHPKLGAYLDRRIKSGELPEAAAAQAKSEKQFIKEISEIENSMGQDFVDLISYLFYGPEGNSPKQSQQSQSPLVGVLNQLKQLQAQLKARKGG